MPTATFVLAVPFLLAAIAVAQRPDAVFEHQKRTATITYGAVPVGKHTLAELQAGQPWRLGMNEASTWRLEMPLLAGDTVIAPGSYRVQLERTGETGAALLANGAGLALGSSGDARVPGEIGKAAKPTKKLAVEWRKKGAAANGNQPAQIVASYGEHEWTGDVTVLGHRDVKLGAWKGVAFAVPAAAVEAGAVPIATLGKGEHTWNLVLGKDKVELVPWMQAPTDSFGFGEVKGPDESAVVTGKVEPLDAKPEKPREVLEVLAAKAEKGELRLDVGYGTTVLRLVLPEPKPKAGK